MKLKTILSGMTVALMLGAGAHAAEEGAPSYPLEQPRHADWSFAGIFGHWDIRQLQRGLQVYQEVCAACHSLKYVAFRNLEALGYSQDQVKNFAAGFSVADGPNDEGEMFERPGRTSDYFPSPLSLIHI